MRDYYLLINGEQVGPYTAEQLHELLAQGQLTAESPAWYDGLPDWAKLGTILEPSSPPEPAPVAPAPIRQMSSAPQSTPLPAVATSPAPRSGVVQTNVKQGALVGSFVCLLIGLAFMCFSLFLFFIYGPLFLAAFILSITAMSQGRVAGGVMLLIVTLVVPSVLGFVLFAERASALADSLTHKQFTTAPSTQPANESSAQSGTPIDTADATTPATAVSTTTTTASVDTPSTPATNAVPVVAPETPKPKNAALDAKMGFRTYKLGTPFSQFNPDDLDATETIMKTDIKPYYVKTFDKQLGAAEIDSIALSFVQDILQSVTVKVEGNQSALGLKEALIAAYGQPDKDETDMTETLTWEGDDCTLELSFDLSGGATAVFTSKSVDAKIAAITDQKAKAGAAAGAQNL